MVLVVIQAVQTSRTLYLGGTTGPVRTSPSQLDALGYGWYSLLWVAGVAVIVGITAFDPLGQQIAAAQHLAGAVEAGEL